MQIATKGHMDIDIEALTQSNDEAATAMEHSVSRKFRTASQQLVGSDKRKKESIGVEWME